MKKPILVLLYLCITGVMHAQLSDETKKMACKAWLDSYTKKTSRAVLSGKELDGSLEEVKFPASGSVDTSKIRMQLDTALSELDFSGVEEEIVDYNDEEITLYSIVLESSIRNVSFCRMSKAWIDVNDVISAGGKSLYMQKCDPKKYNELNENSLFTRTEASFCGFADRLYLCNTTSEGENYTLTGTLRFEMPVKVEVISFEASEIGKTKSIAGSKITLIDMKDNIVALRVEKNKSEQQNGFKTMAFHNENKAFNSTKSLACNYAVYNDLKAVNFNPTDDQLTKISANISTDYENDKADVFIYSGTVQKFYIYQPTVFKVFSAPVNFNFTGQ